MRRTHLADPCVTRASRALATSPALLAASDAHHRPSRAGFAPAQSARSGNRRSPKLWRVPPAVPAAATARITFTERPQRARLPVRCQRRQQPINPARVGRPVLSDASSTSRPVAAVHCASPTRLAVGTSNEAARHGYPDATPVDKCQKLSLSRRAAGRLRSQRGHRLKLGSRQLAAKAPT